MGVKEGCLEEGAFELDPDGPVRVLLSKADEEKHSGVHPVDTECLPCVGQI